MTRADARDRIRRILGIVPAVDTNQAGATVGANCSWQPHPSNALLNQCIEKACAIVSVEAQVTDDAEPVSISVAAQTANGPYAVNLAEIAGYRFGSLNVVKAVWWTTSDGGDFNLSPTSFYARERDSQRDWDQAPGLPAWYSVEDYRVWIIPAPSSAGEIRLRAGFGMVAPLDDISEFRGIPGDYLHYLLDVAALEAACAMPGDVEMQARIQILTVKTQIAVKRIAEWYNSDKQQAGQAQVTARISRRT